MGETVPHSTASSTSITSATLVKKRKMSGVKLKKNTAVKMEDGSSPVLSFKSLSFKSFFFRGTPYDLPRVTKTVVERVDWKADRNLINSTTAGMPHTTLSLQQDHHSQAVTATAAHSSSFSGSEKKKEEKYFACNHCTWRGEYNWSLQRHLATHIKPFRCSICDFSTSRKYRLVVHVRKRHTE